MILRAFYDFLTSKDALTDSVRQAARLEIRRLVGSEVYHGRRPRGAGPVCLMLDRAGGFVWAGISGPLGVEAPTIDIHIFAKDTDDKDGSESIEDVYDALRDMLPGFQGTFGDQTVQVISQESEPISQPIQPLDAQDNWTHHYIISYLIGAARTVPAGAS